MIADAELTRFAKLFAGYTKAYGQYAVKKTTEAGKKAGGQPWTVPGAIAPVVWRDHLEGTGAGLGVIMLQENNTCRFAVIDIDDLTVDHVKLEAQVRCLKLPLLVCRSKSGGAHLYVFFTEDVPAKTVRERLTEWCAVLGLSDKTEQFPKQISRANEQEVGNWINIPYQNAERTLRYAFKDGKILGLTAFIEYALSVSVDGDFMEKPYYNEHAEEDLFWEGPPCLITLSGQGGFLEGTRNEGMFAVGVYCRKRFGDAWKERILSYNDAMANLPAKEIGAVVRNLSKKDYTYPCKRAPLNSVCQRRTCLTREYGIGTTAEEGKNEIGAILKLAYPAPDLPLWSFEVNSHRVMVSNDDFYSKDAVNRACMAQADCVPLQISPARWLKKLSEMLPMADVVPMPADAGPWGQIWEQIQMYLQLGVNALVKEEVLTGKVFREDGKAFFRGIDLFAYLSARQTRYKEQMVWQLLRERGAEKVLWHFKDQSANVWVMPYSAKMEQNLEGHSFGRQDEF